MFMLFKLQHFCVYSVNRHCLPCLNDRLLPSFSGCKPFSLYYTFAHGSYILILIRTEVTPHTYPIHIFTAWRQLLSCLTSKIKCLSPTMNRDEPEFTTIIASDTCCPFHLVSTSITQLVLLVLHDWVFISL